MKKIKLSALIFASFAFFGCSENPQEAEVTIQEEGKFSRTISIKIEGKKDAIIEDPYIEEIETLSAEYQVARSNFIKERKNMTPEERQAFGDLQKKSGERVRELQKLRKSYIISKMKEHNGIDFSVETQGLNQAIGETGEYLNNLEQSQ